MNASIQKTLEEKRCTQEECYKRLGRTRDDIVGHILPEVAVELEFLLGIPAEEICQEGQDCDTDKNRNKTGRSLDKYRDRFMKRFQTEEALRFARKFPTKTLRDMGHLPGEHPLPYEILKFMGVASIEGWECYYGASLQGNANPYAYSAWIRLGEIRCARPKGEIPLDRTEIVENLKFLRKNALSLQTNLRKIAMECMMESGILMQQVPAFLTAPSPTCAMYWCGNRPVVQFPAGPISDARFLQALFHAVGHILLHPKRTICLQAGAPLNSPALRQAQEPACTSPLDKLGDLEKAADRFAENLLLTEAEECEIICCGRFMEKSCIQYFSRIFKVRPGIIVERLQQQKKLPSRTLLNSFKVAV